MSMKMTKLVLAIGAMAMAGGAMAATDSATATATVIAPMTVVKSANLAFGNFAVGSVTAGTLAVNTNGSRTVTGGVILPNVTGTVSAAKFDVAGSGTSTYSILYTGSSTTLVSTLVSANTMAYAMCSALTAAASCDGTVSTGVLTTGAQSIYVGGTLTVGASQVPAADYTGTINVIVEYN
jgi:hypothetical protein